MFVFIPILLVEPNSVFILILPVEPNRPLVFLQATRRPTQYYWRTIGKEFEYSTSRLKLREKTEARALKRAKRGRQRVNIKETSELNTGVEWRKVGIRRSPNVDPNACRRDCQSAALYQQARGSTETTKWRMRRPQPRLPAAVTVPVQSTSREPCSALSKNRRAFSVD